VELGEELEERDQSHLHHLHLHLHLLKLFQPLAIHNRPVNLEVYQEKFRVLYRIEQ
jgi:hypothetical protein